MPIDKEHIVKVENDQNERAVQIRTDTPGSPVEGQIWYDSSIKQVAVHAGGIDRTINTRVLVADPLLPVEGEAWINTTDGKFKYYNLGVTHVVDMEVTTTSQLPDGSLYAILTDAELSNLSSVGLLYPNFVMDTFNEQNPPATLVNVHAAGQALKLVPGHLSGSASYDLPTSTNVRNVQGVAVYTPTAVQPLTTVDNLDGTTTLTIQGDVSGLFAIGKRTLIFKEINVDNQVRSVYVTNPANDYPSIMLVVAPAPSYDGPSDKTTVKINNNGVNILTQLGVAQDQIIMYPLDLKIESGGAGISSIHETQLVDAHGLADLRTLGDDVFRKVTSDISRGTINKCRVRQSANKQYTIIATVHLLDGDIGEMIFYYSNDSLATINRMVGTFSMGQQGGNFNADELLGQERYLNEQTMLVNDDGRFILVHPFLSVGAANVLNRIAYGNLNDASPTLTYFQDFGGGVGTPWNNATPGANLTVLAVVPDDTWDYVYVAIAFGDYPSGQFGADVWYRNGGATFIGQSPDDFSRWNSTNFVGRWYNTLEGEKQVVLIGQTWNTGYTSIRKKKLSQILAVVGSPINNTGYRTNPALDGETRDTILSTDEALLQAASMDNDAIRFIYYDLTTSHTEYGQINLGAVFQGQNEIQHIAFSSQPASGQWSISFNGFTTSALGFSATNLQVQAALRLLTSINGPYVNVTGDYIAGFDVEFVGIMGLQNQPPMNFVTNTLQNVSPAPVTINFTTPQPGILPTPPTFNAAGYRWNATGDRVVIHRNRANESTYEGFTSQAYQGNMVASPRRMRSDPAHVNRLFYVMERQNDIGGPVLMDGQIIQIENSDTFLGSFLDNFVGGNNFNAFIRDFTDTSSGDKIAQKITSNKTITLRSIGIRIVGGWASSGTMPNGFRTRDIALRAMLVGVGTDGLPDETNVLEISPTKHCLADIPWSGVVEDTYFRFNTAITNGQQFFLLIYTENFLASIDWPYGQQGTNLNIQGSTGVPVPGLAYFRNGSWAINNGAGIYTQLFDNFIEPIRTPDTFKYSRMDIHLPNSYYGSRFNIQMENVTPTRLMLTYEFGGNAYQDINEQQLKRIAAREMDIPAVGTFLTDVNTPATQFPGYDPDTFDPNLVMHLRMGDPMAQQYSRLGNLRSANNTPPHDPNYPVRAIDWAGASIFNWNFSPIFLLNNTLQGSQPDNRFKSGWCTRFGLGGLFEVYQGSYQCMKADNFVLEVEVVPTAADITGYSGGLTMFVCQYTGNGWYFGLQNGRPYFAIQNIVGTGLSSNISWATNILVKDTYYRLRAMRTDDQKIKLFIWRNISEGWIECQYQTQAFCNNQYFINYDANMYIGGYFNNNYLTDGRIGEVKLAIGTNTFKSDGLVDQRNLYAHANLGEKFIAKRYLSNGVDADQTADNYVYANNDVNVLTLGNKQGLYAARDQMLVYRDLHVSEGKDLAVKVSLDTVSSEDQPAVQGFVMNFSK